MKTSVSVCAIFVLLTGGSAFAQSCPPGHSMADLAAPTDVARTYIRKGAGEFKAARARGKTHTGVDILTRASYSDKAAYAVYAMSDGVVAFAQYNGQDLDDGFGNVIIIDHGNNCYTMVAHLASDPFTPIEKSGALEVAVGQKVKRGERIGYFVDQAKGVDSTGNARRTAAGARWQTHLEFIEAPSGRSGLYKIKEDILKSDGKRADPTPALLDLGYKIEVAP